MRTGIKNAIRAIAFILILAICLLGVNHVLTPKKNPFYSVEPNTMDVLFFGTSMAYCTFNPAVLWNDQGIASYNLGKQQQGISLTYYTMQEAFEYQKPKVAVLETYALSYEYEFPDDLEQGITASSLDDMPLTKTKWDSIRTNVPEEKYLEYAFPFIRTHTNWLTLDQSDFQPMDTTINGYLVSYDRVASTPPSREYLMNEKERPLHGKTSEYFYRILDLCEEKDIPLVLVKAPYPQRAEVGEASNTVRRIARERGVPYIEYDRIMDQLNFDYSGDTIDSQHLNVYGAEKVSQHFEAYLLENFSLPDHRGEAQYKILDQKTEEDYNKRNEMG